MVHLCAAACPCPRYRENSSSSLSPSSLARVHSVSFRSFPSVGVAIVRAISRASQGCAFVSISLSYMCELDVAPFVRKKKERRIEHRREPRKGGGTSSTGGRETPIYRFIWSY